MAEGLEPLKSEDDVEEILRLAVRNTGVDGSTLRDRLQMSADELGISAEALAAAEQQWQARKRGEVEVQLEADDRKLFRKIRVGDFIKHCGSYISVNAFLVWIDWTGDHALSWSLWCLAGWGIGMFIHAFSLLGHGQDEEREFQRWRKKRYKIKD